MFVNLESPDTYMNKLYLAVDCRGRISYFTFLKVRLLRFKADLVKRLYLRLCYWNFGHNYYTPNESYNLPYQLIYLNY